MRGFHNMPRRMSRRLFLPRKDCFARRVHLDVYTIQSLTCCSRFLALIWSRGQRAMRPACVTDECACVDHLEVLIMLHLGLILRILRAQASKDARLYFFLVMLSLANGVS